jgi:quercetin dioxygenase-like cupin family protein
MGFLLSADLIPDAIAPGRTRYLANTDHLMMAVIDFNDGPAKEPDRPHAHPHEQVSYVVEGEVLFFLDGQPTRLKAGDMVTIPASIPHCLQVLTAHARLIDAFTPIREDFLAK